VDRHGLRAGGVVVRQAPLGDPRGLALTAGFVGVVAVLAWLAPAPIRNTIGVALGRLSNLTGSSPATAPTSAPTRASLSSAQAAH
jgi:hypothetical protein